MWTISEDRLVFWMQAGLASALLILLVWGIWATATGHLH